MTLPRRPADESEPIVATGDWGGGIRGAAVQSESFGDTLKKFITESRMRASSGPLFARPLPNGKAHQ